MTSRLGLTLPHPWWHFFFTSWVRDEYDLNGSSFRIEYRCTKCRRDYHVYPDRPKFQVVDVTPKASQETK